MATTTETELLAEVRAAMAADEVRLSIVRTFGHGDAVRVEHKQYGERWKTIKTLLFPADGGTLADTLTMLASMRAEG